MAADDLTAVLIQYNPLIRSIARKYSSIYNPTEDLEQEARLAIFRAWPTCDSSRNISPWLRAVAERAVWNALRDRGERMKVSLARRKRGDYPYIIPIDDMAERGTWDDTGFKIADHFGCLDQREMVVIKAYLDGFTQYEIADIMGVSQMTISRAYQSALAVLRRCAAR